MTRIRNLLPFVFVLVLAGCDECDKSSPTNPSSVNGSSAVNNAKEAINDVVSTPARINGVELTTLHGWLANIYSVWGYLPDQNTVHPVPSLWTPNLPQNSTQIIKQNRQLELYGAGALVVQFNPNPNSGEFNYWKSIDMGALGSSKPFFVAYEHINQGDGSRYIPTIGDKNMNIEQNRQTFRDDIDFIFKNVVLPAQGRYITINGRAVIYMWASVLMEGDFASLLDEVKKKYPVAFIGSGEGGNNIDRLKMFDGLMTYSLGGRANYLNAVESYNNDSANLRDVMRRVESETGKRMLLIPTFQAAYDDTKVPGRNNPQMYPRSKEEMKYHAELIRGGMGSIYDRIGPFVVYSELAEGAAVIESQCLPETLDRPGRFVGCGTARLEVLKEYFGW